MIYFCAGVLLKHTFIYSFSHSVSQSVRQSVSPTVHKSVSPSVSHSVVTKLFSLVSVYADSYELGKLIVNVMPAHFSHHNHMYGYTNSPRLKTCTTGLYFSYHNKPMLLPIFYIFNLPIDCSQSEGYFSFCTSWPLLVQRK